MKRCLDIVYKDIHIHKCISPKYRHTISELFVLCRETRSEAFVLCRETRSEAFVLCREVVLISEFAT